MPYLIIKEYPVVDGDIPYYRDPEGNILQFNDERHCRVFLQLEGYMPEEIELCTFKEVEHEPVTS